MFADASVSNNTGFTTATTQVPKEGGILGDASQDHKYRMKSTTVAASLGKTSSVGSSSAVGRMQPFLVVNHIIKV